MADDVQVVVDGADATSVSKRPRSPLVMGVLGLTIGVGFGAVFFSPIASREPTPTTVSATASAASPAEPTDSGTTEVIPGFTDALVAVAAGDTDSLNHLLWPREGSLRQRPMFAGETVFFDATAQHLAVSQTVPDMEGVVLAVGRFNSIQTIASGVTSFAWHDSASKHMGYTTMEDGVWTLWHMTPDLRSHRVITDLVPGGELIGWGDWGWAIQEPDEQVVLLNPVGDLRATHEGVALTSTPDGWILVVADTIQMVSGGGGVRGLGVGSGIVGMGPVIDASVSPDGGLVAVSGRESTVVLSVDSPSESPIAQFDLLAADGLAWTSNGQFLLVPTGAGILLLDIESNQVSRILDTYSILAVDVIPPLSS